ncbi:MAG: hypothetical protein ACR2LN_03875 [Candidatus Levyibacteriota bacterium]
MRDLGILNDYKKKAEGEIDKAKGEANQQRGGLAGVKGGLQKMKGNMKEEAADADLNARKEDTADDRN